MVRGMKTGLIVAMDPKGLIGANGTLPWRYKEDLRRFKQVTDGGTLIMGRRTFKSLPGLLPGRKHIVLTTQNVQDWPIQPDGHTSDLQQALALARTWGNDVWVAGGSAVYWEALVEGWVDVVDLTLVPEVNTRGMDQLVYWTGSLEGLRKVSETPNPNDARLTHVRYER